MGACTCCDSVYEHLKKYGRVPDSNLNRMFDKKSVSEDDIEQLQAEKVASAEAHTAAMDELAATVAKLEREIEQLQAKGQSKADVEQLKIESAGMDTKMASIVLELTKIRM